jgi:hypothetical protein
MPRAFLVLALTLAVFAASAQTSPTLSKASNRPKGVADLFLSCPFIGIDVDGPTDDNPQGEKGLFDFSRDPKYGTEGQFEIKSDLLRGNYLYLDDRNPVTKLVVDEKDGYLRITMRSGQQDLVIVYYKHPDGSLIPAVRFEEDQGEFPDIVWGFYDISGGTWSRIDDSQMLPPEFIKAFIPTPAVKDRDCFALTGWDISLPQFGTTARLIPLSNDSDNDDPHRTINVPDSSRTVTQGEYDDWFVKKMYVGKSLKSLELKWSKADGHFLSGQVLPWDPEETSDQASH